MVALRAGMSTIWTRDFLIASGVEIRSLAEASALAGKAGRAQRARPRTFPDATVRTDPTKRTAATSDKTRLSEASTGCTENSGLSSK